MSCKWRVTFTLNYTEKFQNEMKTPTEVWWNYKLFSPEMNLLHMCVCCNRSACAGPTVRCFVKGADKLQTSVYDILSRAPEGEVWSVEYPS